MTAQDVKNKIYQFTPSFIKRVDILEAVYDSIANRLFEFYEAVIELKDAAWTGKGLKLKAKENQIFFNKEDTEADIRERLQQRFLINQERATVNRIPIDVQNVLGGEINIVLQDPEQRGWFVDKTYPMIDYVFIDAPKLVIIEDEYEPEPNEIVDLNLHKELIKRKIVPIDAVIIRVQI